MAGVGEERSEEPGGRDPAPGQLRIVQLFVNTRNIEAGLEMLADPQVASRWLMHKGLTTEPQTVRSEADLYRVVALREALRAALIASHERKPPPVCEVEVLAAAATAGSLTIDVDSDGNLRVVPTAAGLDAALARVVLIAVEATESGQWRRLKVCSNDRCRWAFWDSSRNRSGRWCTMALCGNQAKVRTHRQRAAT